MPTNVFFSPKVNTEQYMFEDIIIESIKMYGQDVFYMPRKIVQRDLILGEDVESEFNTANTVEMFIENTEGFEGEGNIFQKFGMEIRDEATFIVAKRSWQKLVGVWNSDINDDRPREGDLIYLPLSKSFFEISYVEHEQPFYQLSNLPVFKLQARLFEFNEEEFNTGIAEVDGIENNYGYQEVFEYGSKSGTFELGERIKYISAAAQVASASAIADFGTSRGIGRLTGINVINSGFSYSNIPTVTVSGHDNSDKTLEGSLSNSTITQDQSKFGSWSVHSPDPGKYHITGLDDHQLAGTVEFFFKTKAAESYTGIISRFGDFKIELNGNQVVVYHKNDNASAAFVNTDWNHIKVSVDNTGGTYTHQIYVNGTRVVNGTTATNSGLIGQGGQWFTNRAVKFHGVNSGINDFGSNGIYFDGLSVNTTAIANSTTIAVPTSIQTNDVINDQFNPIAADGTAVMNANNGIATITLTNRGRFYEALPSVSITASTAADTPETNVSAQLLGITQTTITVNQIETSDGLYHKFAVGNTLVGETSSATCSVTKVYDVESSATDSTFTTDLAARNFNFEDESDDIIDFSESNPFGDAT
jgi:hypothetical protein